jgi:Xaa-Pro aminopeptidase
MAYRKAVREKGLDIAFEPIVAVDANAAVPHYDTKEGSALSVPTP